MDSTTTETLLALNRRFYRRFAGAFGASRQKPWSGWRRIVDRMLDGPPTGVSPFRILDLGCGNGRFARCVAETLATAGEPRPLDYVGLDANPALLAEARRDLDPLEGLDSRLIEVELAENPESDLEDHLGGEAPFHLVVLFGVLHHIPRESLRHRLLAAAARALAPGGRLAASAWRLDRRERFGRKVLPWPEHNRRAARRGEPLVDLDQLEPGDHLLTWSGEREVPRYCHFPTDEELDRWSKHLASPPSTLQLIDRFEGDGPGDRDNLYLVWRR